MADISFNCPFCKQHYEAPDGMAGENIDCGKCKKKITIPKVNDQPCIVIQPTPPLSTSKQSAPPEKAPGSSAINAGWICLIIGGVIYVSVNEWIKFTTFAIVAGFPLFLAAFILSIVGMAKGRVGRGIFLLLSVFIVPFLFDSFYGGYKLAKESSKTGVPIEKLANNKSQSDYIDKTRQLLEQKQILIKNIVFEDIKVESDENYMYCTGKVRNNNPESVQFVKVSVEWLDKDKKVLDSDSIYAVSSDELRPNSAKSFKIMTSSDKRMESCQYRVESVK